jgi:Rps23 Pro-64 3,4-dihydroxylase Tpa1-like proline 4-hydroxylase
MIQYLNTQYQNLQEVATKYKSSYNTDQPFPHIYFEDFFNPAFLNLVREEFPDLSKLNTFHYNNPNEKKFASKGEADMGPNTRQLIHFLQSETFLKFLQELTSIKETLLGDPYLVGGGLHEIKAGGLLKVHADFNKHALTGLDRRLNILVYLNKDWKEEYGGHFELWNRQMTNCAKRILPTFNTLAMFSTTDTSYHGHPDPLTCPEGNSRKSIALYYYSNGRPQHEIDPSSVDHSTLFKARAGFTGEVVDTGSSWKEKVKLFVPPIVYKLKDKLTGKES